MTVFKSLSLAVAGTALVAAPIAASAAPAQANPAASLSVARAAAPASGKGSKLGASVPTTTLISIGILAALTAIVLVATDNSDSN